MANPQIDLSRASIPRTVLKYAIPCAATMVVNSLYTLVDQIFIGRGIGYLANAATNVIFPLNVVVLAIGLLIGDGCATFFSISYGKGQKERSSKGIGNALVLLIAAAICILILSLTFLNQIIALCGGTDLIYDYCRTYGMIIAIGLPFYLLATGCNSLLRADGRPRLATISMTLGAIINVILDPTFIFLCKWGGAGAALATILGQFVSAVISVAGVLRLKTVPLRRKDFQLDLHVCRKFTRYGLSSCLLQLAVMVGFIVNNNLLTIYGADSIYGSKIPLTTFGIMIKFDHIMTVCIVGIAQGAQTLIGHNLGTGNFTRVRQAIRDTLWFAIGVSVVFWAVFMIFPQQLLHIFGNENDLYNEFGVKCFRIYLLLVVGNGI